MPAPLPHLHIILQEQGNQAELLGRHVLGLLRVPARLCWRGQACKHPNGLVHSALLRGQGREQGSTSTRSLRAGIAPACPPPSTGRRFLQHSHVAQRSPLAMLKVLIPRLASSVSA